MTFKKTLIFSLFIGLFSCSENLNLPENDYFLKILGYNGQDEAVALQLLENEDLLLAGNLNLTAGGSALFWTKLNKYGVTQWQFTWNEQENQEMKDWILRDDRILATGLVKGDSTYLGLWEMDATSGKLIQFTKPIKSKVESWGQKLLQTQDGGLLIVGNYSDTDQTVRYEGMIFQCQNSDGTEKWETQHHQLEPFEQLIAAAEINNQFYLFGNVGKNADKKLRIICLNSDGQILYTNIYGETGGNVEAVSASFNKQGVQFLATEGTGNNRRMLLGELNLSAELIKANTIDSDLTEFAADFCRDTQGNYFVIGNRIIDARKTDCLLQKRDVNFNLIWEQTYGSEWQDKAEKVFIRSTGPGFLATVNFDNKNENANTNMAIYSLDQEGNLK
ncbi:hypothetical protein [Persicobacter sp. CCB-QB2]|uniref:hypothetical protein n=1 Tax=Persicobacter sp. CCB-QB2 TaxID=1561025 RepID=UPI0006A999B8|nr:hypothetical protein [Persicobacter sp. CCB-QB2]